MVSSESNFCPDTRGVVVVTYFRLVCSVVLWGGRNTANKYHWCVFTVIQQHWVCPCSRRVCFPGLYCSGSGCSAGNCLMLALGCMHSPGLSCSGSASRVLHKGADLVAPAFCAHPRSEQLRWPGAWWAQLPPIEGCNLSPPPSQQLSFLGVQWVQQPN